MLYPIELLGRARGMLASRAVFVMSRHPSASMQNAIPIFEIMHPAMLHRLIVILTY